MHALQGADEVWLPPLRIRLAPFLEFNRRVSVGLRELETRYPPPRGVGLAHRRIAGPRRRPRPR